MAEWLKAHDSKSCGRVDRLGGSNPLASAIGSSKIQVFGFVPSVRILSLPPLARMSQFLFLGFRVEFGEFLRLFVQLGEFFFARDVLFARINKVAENTDQDEGADKNRVENRPKDNADNEGASNGESIGIGDESGGGVAGTGDGVGELLAEGGESVTEVDEDEVGDTEEDTADGATDSTTIIATDSLASSSNGVANLAKDAFDGAGNSKVGGDSGKALFDNFFALSDDVGGELIFGDTFGHHGDLTGLVGIGNKFEYDINYDDAEYGADSETNQAFIKAVFSDEKATDNAAGKN